MLHLDEARERAIAAARKWTACPADDRERALLIEDLFGRFRAAVWGAPARRAELAEVLHQATTDPRDAGTYWSGDLWSGREAQEPERAFYRQAWEDGRELVPGRLRVLDRHRSRQAWFSPVAQGPWLVGRLRPPVVAFYSFKGGVGRTTALAAFAIQRARAGERVLVIDADLDAPGLGSLLPATRDGSAQTWGVVDYLLERPLCQQVDLRDYYHAFRDETVVGSGEILVVPAGRVNCHFLEKLARVDLEPAPQQAPGDHPLHLLVQELSTALRPAWILLDCRSGLSEMTGVILSGLAHLQVVVGTASAQSWEGLTLVLRHLGEEQVRVGLPQGDCVLVHSMVPPTAAAPVRRAFEQRAREVFETHFYAETSAGDAFWTVADAEGSDAPHVPIPLSYDETLAAFGYIGEVASRLTSDEFLRLGERIRGRFRRDA